MKIKSLIYSKLVTVGAKLQSADNQALEKSNELVKYKVMIKDTQAKDSKLISHNGFKCIIGQTYQNNSELIIRQFKIR